MHDRDSPTHCIRLIGYTIKVWSSKTLCTSQDRPLLTIHDVVKHLQLDDGRLFLWRIQEGAIIQVESAVGDQEEEEECLHWTENTNLIASVLDPITLELVDVPLDSTYGQGTCPFEFMDGGVPDVLIIAGANLVESHIKIRLMDLKTGQCFRESSIALPEVGNDALNFNVREEAAAMLLRRNSHVSGQSIVGALSYDCKVFQWRLKDEWMAPETRYAQHEDVDKVNSPPAIAPTEVAVEEGLAVDDDAAHTTFLEGDTEVPNEPAAQFSLRHIFSTFANEPICDLSTCTSSKRIYVAGLGSLYVLSNDGTLLYIVPTYQWRGVQEARARFRNQNVDVCAFSWPLPNSPRVVFHLDLSNSLYVANFEDATEDPHDAYFQYGSAWMRRTAALSVVSHADLLPQPRTLTYAITHRLTVNPNDEPFIMENIQSGKTIFTSGDSSCNETKALLKREKKAGTYLYGLGPNSVKRGKEKNTGPFVSRPGGEKCNARGNRDDKRKGRKQENKKSRDVGSVAPRAIICIDTETGRRYKTIPIEGVIECIHAAGHLLIVAVAPVDNYPDGAQGSLVVIDFSKEGFGLTDAQHAEQRQIQRNEHGGKNQPGGDLVQINKKSVKAGLANSKMPGERQNATAAEAGPSKAKRSRRSGQ